MEPAGVAWLENRLCQLSPGVPSLGAGPGQSCSAAASLPLPEGEPSISRVLHPLGAQPLLAGAPWPLVPPTTPLPPEVPRRFVERGSCPPALRTMCGACAQAAEGGSRVGCGGGAWGGTAGGLLREQSLAAAGSGLPACPRARSHHIHPQSQRSRPWGACCGPGPCAGPGSCSAAAPELPQPLRAAPALASLGIAAARRGCGRGGGRRRHRQGPQHPVLCPTELGGSSTGWSWMRKGHTSTSTSVWGSGPVRSPLPLRHGDRFSAVLVQDAGSAGGRKAEWDKVEQGDAACPGPGPGQANPAGTPTLQEPCVGQ